MTRSRLTPGWLVCTGIVKDSPLTAPVAGKSSHSSPTARCTWRMAPSPPG